MDKSLVRYRRYACAAALVLITCIAVTSTPLWAEQGTGGIQIQTVYRNSWKITINGKPQVAGTFTMVFTPLNGDPVRFTVNVMEKMKPKKIREDLWKELSLAAGSNYKVKKNGDRVVTIKTANKKVPSMALEVTEQKLSGMSITISAN